MTKLEEVKEAERVLFEAELEYEKEKFFKEPRYWSLIEDDFSIRDILYSQSTSCQQSLLSEEEKNITWKNYEMLLRKQNS